MKQILHLISEDLDGETSWLEDDDAATSREMEARLLAEWRMDEDDGA